METIVVPYEKYETLKEDIDSWLRTRGQGTARYGGREDVIKHWLGGDDWCYYNQWSEDRTISSTVFLFRKEQDAVEFALRFA
jgi:hypothetical protein